MKTKNAFSLRELNALIRTITDSLTGKQLTAPDQWRRVDCGNIEVYVGDRKYVIALVDKLTDTKEEIVTNQINTEDTVIKYLKSEGFLNDNFPDDGEAYVGMQQFALDKLLGDNE